MAQHQERSKVWRYFTRTSDNLKAKCHLCLSMLSFKGGSISNLHLHLKRKHAEHLDEQSGTLIKNSLPDPLKDIEKIEFFRNDENVKKLIELVRQRGNILYKFSKHNIWNSETQEKLWKEVSEALEYRVSYNECRLCWRNLRYLYDLYKKDPKSHNMKFVNQLSFLDSLYIKSKTTENSFNEKKRKLSSMESEQLINDIIDNKNIYENLEESYLDESDEFSHLNQNDEIFEETNNSRKFRSSRTNEITEKSLSYCKSFEEMDDLDFFFRFFE